MNRIQEIYYLLEKVVGKVSDLTYMISNPAYEVDPKKKEWILKAQEDLLKIQSLLLSGDFERLEKIVEFINDDEKANGIAENCHDPNSHDPRWCATCEARKDGIDEYRHFIKLNILKEKDSHEMLIKKCFMDLDNTLHDFEDIENRVHVPLHLEKDVQNVLESIKKGIKDVGSWAKKLGEDICKEPKDFDKDNEHPLPFVQDEGDQ